jgi:hypothetical protein
MELKEMLANIGNNLKKEKELGGIIVGSQNQRIKYYFIFISNSWVSSHVFK